jgi:electron transport complex protein RnfD
MGEKLLVTSSPHLKGPKTVRGLMLDVILSLVPASIAAVVIFGPRSLTVILASVVSAVASEAIFEKAVKRDVTVNDLSAVITGLLLALTLPPGVRLYVPVVGSAFAVIVAKQIFGGLGTNFVNPALAGRAFVMAAWPLQLSSKWVAPFTFDAVSGSTPLAVLRSGQTAIPSISDILIGNRLGSLGETCVLALLLGASYLIARGVIDWRLPAGYIGAVFAGAWVFGKSGAYFQGDGLTAVLLGGVILGAFFMATDYVTSPVTGKGRLYMGIGAGIVTILIRLWGTYPEGVTYGILFMNLVTPLIDRFMVPRYYGYVHDVSLRRKARAAGRRA